MDSLTKASSMAEANSSSAIAKGIFVLGMHRSGTSACTRVLNLLGCSLSGNLLGEGEGNEKGHWEAIEAISLNDEMLASAGSSHEDWGEVNPDWKSSAIRSQMVEKASAVLADHAKIGPLFALKDPRMCRLADVWLEAAAAANVEPHVLIMLRNPLEVIASLDARDLMAEGYAELLWLRHVLDAEHYSRGHKRLFYRYDQLIANGQSLIGKIKGVFNIALPRNTPKVHAEINNFLSSSHRHHHADPAMVLDDLTRSSWLRQTYRIMSDWSQNGENKADYAILDEIRAELNRSHSVFARLLLTSEMTGEVGSGAHLRNELGTLRQQIADQTEALQIAEDATEREKASARQNEAEFLAELERLRAGLVEAQAAASLSDQARTEAEDRYAKAQEELGKQQLQNAELSGRVDSLQSTIVQRQEELSQLLFQLSEAEQKRLRAEFELEREREQRLALQQSMEAAKAEIAALQAELEEAANQTAAEVALRHEEAQRLSQQASKSESAAKEAEGARIASERKLTARFEELARLTAILADESRKAEMSENQSAWLREVHRLEESFPTWWSLMPQSWRRRRTYQRYLRAGLFDAVAYLNTYPDVAEQGMDPIRHYILHGMAEGRVRTL